MRNTKYVKRIDKTRKEMCDTCKKRKACSDYKRKEYPIHCIPYEEETK